MLKKEIRKIALKERMALSEEEFEQRNAQLLEHFSKLDFSDVKALHIFLPIETKREPNTFLLIDWLERHKPNIKIIVPKADFETALMTHHKYIGKGNLQKNLFEILEPENSMVFDGKIDMVIVPLLAFDLAGNRVGYGKGFYDAFLKQSSAKKIGLSLTDMPVEITDIGSNDVPLDLCITPNGIKIFC